MSAILSIGIWALLGLVCVVFFLLALLTWLLFAPFDSKRRVNHLISCVWAHAVAFVNPGWRVRVSGRRRIAYGKAHVLVANHTSLADVVMGFMLYRQFKWVSKASVFKVPVLGWNMRFCRYVPLTRRDPQSIAKMMETCRRWLRQGISVMIFPEGTRSLDGQVKSFKHGAFTLALETGAPVVPIAIHGGREIIAKHKKGLSSRANVHVEVLEPVCPEGFSDADSYGEAVRGLIRDALGQSEISMERSSSAAAAR